MPRAPTPGFARHRRQFSGPGLGHRRDESESSAFEERMPRRRSPSPRPRAASRRQSYQSYSSDMEKDCHDREPPRAARRSASRRRGSFQDYRRPGQLRVGSGYRYVLANACLAPSRVHVTAPRHTSQPPVRYAEADEVRTQPVYEDYVVRSSGSDRPLRQASPRPYRGGLAHRVRENVQSVEGQSSGDDYDWYDKDGMRVRVREI